MDVWGRSVTVTVLVVKREIKDIRLYLPESPMGIIILIKGIAHKMQTILLGILFILLRSKMNIPVSVATRDIFSTQ